MIQTAAIVHSPMIAIVVQMTRWPDHPISRSLYKTLPRLTDSLPILFANGVLICIDVRTTSEFYEIVGLQKEFQ